MHQSVLAALLGLGLGLGLGLAAAFPSQQPDSGKHWVVIVAGSNGWFNYRHQVSDRKSGGTAGLRRRRHGVTLSGSSLARPLYLLL